MRVLIAGGGIGGLSAAIALAREGFEPLVMEQAEAISEVGAGLAVAPNAMRALEYLGADAHVRACGVRSEREVMYELVSGDRIALRALLGENAYRRYGEYQYYCHRADLLDGLLRQTRPEWLRVGAQVLDFRETESTVTVTLKNGEQLDGDLLVGADGVRSIVRSTLFGESEPKFLGVVSFRAILPRTLVPHLPLSPGELSGFTGGARQVGIYPVRPDAITFNVSLTVPDATPESWTALGDLDHLRQALKDTAPAITRALDSMAEAGIRPLSTGKYFRDPLDSWSSGRVTLLGDAAHPAGSPAAGQGAAMAIEDAVTLAICLRHHGSTHIAAGLAEYEQRRIARTISMFIQARSLNSMLYEEDPVRIRGRNNRLRGMERMDPESVVLWGPLHGFDAIAEARTPLEKLRRDTDEPLREREPARRAARVWRDALAVEDRVGGWVSERRGYERVLGQATPVPASAQRADYDGVSVIDVPGGDGPTLVYIHGGGFELGSALSYAGVAARVAAAIGGRAIVPDYRLAPEYPAPAAIDDVMATVRWLTRRSPNGYVLCGDEAGAGLAVAAAMRLRDEGTALPLAIYCFSPLIDLSLSSPSIDANPGKDPWHTRQILTWRASGFLAGEIPGASPWPPQRADLIGLPPAIIWAGDDEALRDDAVALAHGMQEAELVLVRDSVTAFVLFDYLPESADALALLKRHLTELLKRERQDN